jgi:26S proteasome regulatory subunit N8
MDITNVIKSFAMTTNDEMLAIYLSSMIRAVISLHGLIDNKLELKEAEKNQDKADPPAGATMAVENKA